jgi:hypothetical protein
MKQSKFIAASVLLVFTTLNTATQTVKDLEAFKLPADYT